MFLKLSLLPLLLSAQGIDFSPEPPRTTFRELQLENEQTRVWKTTIIPFSPLKMHRHELPRVIVGLKGGTLKRITEKGEISYLTFETGQAYWLEADQVDELHVDINESREPIEVMVVEFR